VAHKGEKRNEDRVLDEKSGRKATFGTTRLSWKHHTNMDVKELGWTKFI
jgi:hypothetical protein